MKKFVFSLHKLYGVKQSAERQKRLQLKELDKLLNEYKKDLNILEDTFAHQRRQYDKACKRGIGVFDLKNYGDYFLFLTEEMSRQKNLIVGCEAEVERCKQELIKLMNEQKVLNRMREEQLLEYNQELQKDSEKAIEDFMQAR